MKKLKLVLSRQIYTGLLAEIKEANKELRVFVEGSNDFSARKVRPRSRRQSLKLKNIRRQAKSLYNVLVIGRYWKCGCKDSHTVNLRLEPRPWGDGMTKGAAAETSNTRFKVFLAKKPKHTQEEASEIEWERQELEVETLETLASPLFGVGDSSQLDLAKSLTEDP